MPKKKYSASPDKAPKRYMVLVLGTHRSGTSAIAGVLHHLGCTVPKRADNEYRYFESEACSGFHDTLFEQAGTTWADWHQFNMAWLSSPNGEAFFQAGRDLLNEAFGDAPLLAFKDPRMCRLVPFWRDVATAERMKVLPVLNCRNPVEVAKSLEKHDNIDISESMLIWLRHILDAEIDTRGGPRFITDYDRVMNNWPAEIARLQEKLDIVFPRFNHRSSAKIDGFLSDDMRHFHEPVDKVIQDPILSTWIGTTYEIFRRWANTGETHADHETLDHIRAGFNAAGPLFSQLVGPDSRLAQALENKASALEANRDALQIEHDSLKEKLAPFETLQANLSTAESALDELRSQSEAERDQLAKDIQARDAQVKELTDEIERQKDSHSKITTELSQRNEQLGTMKAELVVYEERLTEAQDALSETRHRLAETESALAQRRLEVEEATEATDALATERDQLLEKLSVTTERLAAVEQELAEKSDRATELERKLDDQSDDIKTLEKQCSRQAHELAETAQLLAKHIEDMAAQEAQLSQVQTERSNLQSHVQFLEDELSSLRNSTFWRMTAPFRAVVDTLRGNR